ncbi:MAG: FAD-dependent oxidoreductase, partial [Firmicutes bacterium]|nr:FAD-dependent oxidoreductase [Bacillota bacterium]
QHLNIPGEKLKGVHLAMDFLARVSEGAAGKPGDKVAVIGGGDVAFDCARSALRLGSASVLLVYRRTGAEMPALAHEIKEGQDEGIVFNYLTAPEAIIDDGKGKVAGLQCVRMELGEPDSSGRRKPVPVKDSSFKILCDSVILAIGQAPSSIVDKMLPGAKKNSKGLPEVNSETLATNLPGIFAGGDIINGGTTVVQAVAEGKRAARGIHKFLD